MLLPPKVFFTMARDASKGSGGITSYFLFHMRFHSFPSRQTSRRALPGSAGLGTRPCRYIRAGLVLVIVLLYCGHSFPPLCCCDMHIYTRMYNRDERLWAADFLAQQDETI